jgi:hypothetical protein
MIDCLLDNSVSTIWLVHNIAYKTTESSFNHFQVMDEISRLETWDSILCINFSVYDQRWNGFLLPAVVKDKYSNRLFGEHHHFQGRTLSQAENQYEAGSKQSFLASLSVRPWRWKWQHDVNARSIALQCPLKFTIVGFFKYNQAKTISIQLDYYEPGTPGTYGLKEMSGVWTACNLCVRGKMARICISLLQTQVQC